jgi:hypothetical protein
MLFDVPMSMAKGVNPLWVELQLRRSPVYTCVFFPGKIPQKIKHQKTILKGIFCIKFLLFSKNLPNSNLIHICIFIYNFKIFWIVYEVPIGSQKY